MDPIQGLFDCQGEHVAATADSWLFTRTILKHFLSKKQLIAVVLMDQPLMTMYEDEMPYYENLHLPVLINCSGHLLT
jgi:hypothetical protein